MKQIVVGSDHAGLRLKRQLISVLEERGLQVVDVGTDSEESTDYPDYAHQVATAVANGDAVIIRVHFGERQKSVTVASKINKSRLQGRLDTRDFYKIDITL